MNKTFLAYPTLEAAAAAGCFNCHTLLDQKTLIDAGYPAGRMRMTCPQCGYHTYFDVTNAEAA